MGVTVMGRQYVIRLSPVPPIMGGRLLFVAYGPIRGSSRSSSSL
jgi:hypothetical protein